MIFLLALVMTTDSMSIQEYTRQLSGEYKLYQGEDWALAYCPENQTYTAWIFMSSKNLLQSEVSIEELIRHTGKTFDLNTHDIIEVPTKDFLKLVYKFKKI